MPSGAMRLDGIDRGHGLRLVSRPCDDPALIVDWQDLTDGHGLGLVGHSAIGGYGMSSAGVKPRRGHFASANWVRKLSQDAGRPRRSVVHQSGRRPRRATTAWHKATRSRTPQRIAGTRNCPWAAAATRCAGSSIGLNCTSGPPAMQSHTVKCSPVIGRKTLRT